LCFEEGNLHIYTPKDKNSGGGVKTMSAYSKKSGFLNGKGFYLALALCLAGAGTAAYFAAPQGEPLASESSPSLVVERPSEIVKKTEKPVENIKKESEKPVVREELSIIQTELETAAEPASQVPVAKPAPSFVAPVEGEMLTEFSNGELVKNETLGDWRTHNGADIRADEGTQVVSVSDGTVTGIEDDPVWGTSVTIDHGKGIVSVYRGLGSTLSVKTGEKVSAGQPVGTVGKVPAESLLPSHLHFEMTKDGEYIDPAEKLKLK